MAAAVQTRGAKNWEEIAALDPDRTKEQCHKRWHDTYSNIDPMTERVGKWTADEGKMLNNAVRAHGAKNGEEIAALVPGRTKKQCHNRWRDTLDSNIDPTTARVGKWTADECKLLKDAIPMRGAKNWVEIAALVPGRTNQQCQKRWHDT